MGFTKKKTNTIDSDYEFRVYNKSAYNYGLSDYGPCPTVVMSRHQGFQWNDELFVSEYQKSAGYDCHKSDSLEKRERRISQQYATDRDVIDIQLTEEECDVRP
ncbi:hypothetical protein BY458DRAFT_497056 [Sporodiniella umbellata]|nr:hypothetical protein BY458DRAFT_497056 [Sporodiniella umbellata]